MAKKPKRDFNQEVTDKIIACLEAGPPPWRNPILAATKGFPASLSTGKEYRGMNVFLLLMTQWDKGYSSSHWATFKQAKAMGGQVRKGEKATPVIFWKLYEKEDKETGLIDRLPVLRCYSVFNTDQCDGIENPVAAETTTIDFTPIEKAQQIVGGYARPPTIKHGGNRAFYVAKDDQVQITEPQGFESAEAYYCTLFHELAHSTGHEKRLNRPESVGTNIFGSSAYSKEELVAEMASAFLCARAGISPPTIEQSAAYIAGWKKKLSSDNKVVIQAAGLAQKAVDHILGVTFDEAARPPPSAKPIEAPKPPPPESVPASQLELF